MFSNPYFIIYNVSGHLYNFIKCPPNKDLNLFAFENNIIAIDITFNKVTAKELVELYEKEAKMKGNV